jgi:predicted small lipoprotein YifL
MMRNRGLVRRGGLVAVLLVLAGCGTIGPIFKPGKPPPVEIVIPPVGAARPATVAAMPPVLPRPKPVIEAPLPTSGDFVGLSVKDVQGMIGKPSLLREDHKVQVWHYRNVDCTLFLFFYPKGAEGYRVDHVDVADTRINPTPPPGMTPSQVHRQTLESCVASTMMSFGSQKL